MRSSLPGLLVFLATSILCLGADRALAQEPTTTGLMVARPILRVRDAQIPVQLESVDIRADVLGRFAHTRIELVFRNPNARVLEGELQFPLAPGQMVTGFALDIGGEMRSAVPVDKSKGQQVFEDVIRTRSIPHCSKRPRATTTSCASIRCPRKERVASPSTCCSTWRATTRSTTC